MEQVPPVYLCGAGALSLVADGCAECTAHCQSANYTELYNRHMFLILCMNVKMLNENTEINHKKL